MLNQQDDKSKPKTYNNSSLSYPIYIQSYLYPILSIITPILAIFQSRKDEGQKVKSCKKFINHIFCSLLRFKNIPVNILIPFAVTSSRFSNHCIHCLPLMNSLLHYFFRFFRSLNVIQRQNVRLSPRTISSNKRYSKTTRFCKINQHHLILLTNSVENSSGK